MNQASKRDYITIEDEQGEQRQYAVEGLFGMNDKSYAMLSSNNENLLMEIEESEGEQYLVNINDPKELEYLLEAYQIAVEAQPEE